MLRFVAFALGFALGAFLPVCPAQADRTGPAVDPALTRRVEVKLVDGHLHLGDLVRALLAEFELDGDELPLPDSRVDLRGMRGSLVLLSARQLLRETVSFRRDLAGDRLVVTIDRVRVREVRRELRAALAALGGRLLREDTAARAYALPIPEPLDATRPLVVLIHGVESDPGSWHDLREYLAAPPRACQVTTFAYPNDEAAERVAVELSTRLRGLGAQPVAIVAHSFGGLVARSVIEDPALDPGNVRTLVLIGTPNAGSNLAGLRVALELADALRDTRDGERFASKLPPILVDHWRDGLGEAGGDLLPGSVLLTRLAQRARNPDVTYHAVLGTRSLLSEAQLADVRAAATRQLDDHVLGRVAQRRIERWLEDLDELLDGRGDGVVSVARGRLAGVEPVLLPLDHVGLIRRRGLLSTPDEAEHPVFALVAGWVEGQSAPGARGERR